MLYEGNKGETERTGEGKKINRRRYTRQPINRAQGPRGQQDCFVSHSCGKLDRWKCFKARQIRVANGHVRGRARPPHQFRKNSRENAISLTSFPFISNPASSVSSRNPVIYYYRPFFCFLSPLLSSFFSLLSAQIMAGVIHNRGFFIALPKRLKIGERISRGSKFDLFVIATRVARCDCAAV